MNKHQISRRQQHAQRRKQLLANPLYGLSAPQATEWIDQKLQHVNSVAQLRQATQDIALALAELVTYVADEPGE